MEPNAHKNCAAPRACDEELEDEIINKLQGLSLENKCDFIQSLFEKSYDGSEESLFSFYQECEKTIMDELKVEDLRDLCELSEEKFLPIVINRCSKLLLGQTKSIIQEFFDLDIHKFFLATLKDTQNEGFIYGILWSITYLLDGEKSHARALIDYEAIKVILPFISSSNDRIRYVAFMAIERISATCSEFNHIIFEDGAYDVIIEQALNEPMDHDIFRKVSSTLSYLMYKFTELSDEQVISVADVFINGLEKATKTDILKYCAKGLSYISRRNATISKILERGAISKMVQLLQSPEAEILEWLLISFCDMSMLNDSDFCSDLIENAFISSIAPILSHSDISIKKLVLVCLSYLAKNFVLFCNNLINSHVMDKVLLYINSEEIDLCKQSLFIITGMALNENLNIFQRLHEKGVLAKICEALMNDSYSSKCVELILKTIECCLETYRESNVCDAQNHMKNFLLASDSSNTGLQKLKDLEDHPHDAIAEAAECILSKFFPHDL